MIHRNMVQVYEQFNWFVWAVSNFYFENSKYDKNPYGLPPVDNDAWIDGFVWKNVFFRLVPLLQAHEIKQEMEALKHLSLELEECFALEENYKAKFKKDPSKSLHRRILIPLLSISECGAYAIYGTPEINILKKGSNNANE